MILKNLDEMMIVLADWVLRIISGHHLLTLLCWAYLGLHTKVHQTIIPSLFAMMIAIVVGMITKPIIGIPLNPMLSGYAFPSGHMLATTTFWVSVLCQLQASKKILPILVLLLLYGWALIACHFHSWQDVLAGAGLAVSLSAAWSWIYERHTKKLTFFGPITLLAIVYLQAPQMQPMLGCLTGLAISWPMFFHFRHDKAPLPWLHALIGLLCAGIIYLSTTTATYFNSLAMMLLFIGVLPWIVPLISEKYHKYN